MPALDWAKAVFVILAAAIFIGWLAVALLSRVPPGIILRYPAPLRVLALSLALLNPALAIYVIWFSPWHDVRRLNLAALTLLAFSLLGGLLLLETTRTWLTLTDDGFTKVSPWRARRTLLWREVQAVRYSWLNRWFIFQGAGTRIRVSRHLLGLPALMQAVRRHVPEPRYATARRLIEAIAAQQKSPKG